MFKWLKKYFIPHEHNEYQPHFLRHESIVITGFVIIVIQLAFLVQIFVVLDHSKFLGLVLPGVLTEQTNEEREDLGLAPLRENPLLVQAANLKAQDMAKNQYFAHNSPEGKTPWHWLREVGYSYQRAGENLAVNFYESGDITRAWMNSPTHKENIVKPNYTEIGIGIAQGVYQGRNTIFVAQFFGTPLAIANQEVPTPTTPTTPATPEVLPEEAMAQEEPQVSGEEIVLTEKIKDLDAVQTIILGEEAIIELEEIDLGSNSVQTFLSKIAMSPHQSTAYAYGAIALVVIFALALALFIRSEIRHPKMIAKGFALLAVIVVLSALNIKVFYSNTLVPEDLTANTIEVLGLFAE